MKYLFICLVLLVLSKQDVMATNLRGQIVRYNPNTRSYFPLGRVRADLWIWNGVQWLPVAYYITGDDGFYYFLNLIPGTIFKIQVFNNFFPPQPLTVFGINPPYYQDIPWIIT